MEAGTSPESTETTNGAPDGWVGQAIKRKEDPRFITGTGRYIDDMTIPGMLHMAVVRSPEAHAAIVSIDKSEAEAMEGVVAVYTADDLPVEGGIPMVWDPPGVEVNTPEHMPLKSGEVKCVGDPVAVVLGTSKYGVVDAAELVIVEYEPKPVVVDPEAALEEGSPLVWDQFGTNKTHEWALAGGEDVGAAISGADVVVEQRIVNHRTAAAAIECRGCMAEARGDQITLFSSTQIPHITRFLMAGMLGMSEDHIRVVAPDVGGGFGGKLNTYAEEVLVCAISRKLGRPVKWIETRSENMSNTAHGRDQIATITLAAKSDGQVTGVRAKIVSDLGAYFQILTPFIAELGFPVAGGCYKIGGIDLHFTGVFTNKFATDAVRGAGRPEMTHWIEVMMDQLAQRLDMDPLELRRKNFIPTDEFPFTTALDITYDSGDYHGTLDKLLTHLDVDEFRREQAELRERGIHRGLGFSTYVEVCGLAPSRAVGPQGVGLQAAFWESAAVRVHPSGSATVYSGSSPHGQGLDTSFAQIAADRLGISPEQVDVLHGDTNQGPFGWGTYGSRSLSVGGEAIARASERVQAKAKKICAALLEAAPEDIELAGGEFRVRGQPDKTMTMADIAGAAHIPPNELPADIEPGLEETAFYDPENFVFPFGAHACIVDVDTETGKVEVKRWVAVDDCGPAINPMLIDGQVHGGVAHGIGQALYEQVVYDEEGQLVTGSFVDYALPTAAEVPMFETDRQETRSPVNSLGVKGVGEAGTIAATPAVVNAVVDALRPLGIDYLDMPLTPMRIWQAIEEAKGRGEGPRATEQGSDAGPHGRGAAGSGPTHPDGGGVA
ncbi:MAG: xanthine dehydrogenase family protein molybdopterin-binding subunit [Solirubrobacterales bacterium]|nr:xanthine dehydrogenase family protein molybdopterin-binding subunit [Solirubrobacterales bacterium]